MTKPSRYCIQFCPYAGKDATFTEYGDIGLRLGATVVAHLLKMLPPHPGSNYHAVMDNFFISTKLIFLPSTEIDCSYRNCTVV